MIGKGDDFDALFTQAGHVAIREVGAMSDEEKSKLLPAGNRNLCAGVATWRSHLYERDAVTTTLKRAPQTL